MAALITLIWLGLAPFAHAADCLEEEYWKKAPEENSVEACEKMAKRLWAKCDKESATTVFAAVGVRGAQTRCLNAVTRAALDKRLRRWEKNDLTRIREEENVQKLFGLAVRQACTDLNSCDGTMYHVSKLDCVEATFEWRARQLKNINSHRWYPGTDGEKMDQALTPALAKLTEPFASELCRLTAENFKDDTPPVGCKSIVQRQFTYAAGDDCRLHK